MSGKSHLNLKADFRDKFACDINYDSIQDIYMTCAEINACHDQLKVYFSLSNRFFWICLTF